jgi:hypothetical protein
MHIEFVLSKLDAVLSGYIINRVFWTISRVFSRPLLWRNVAPDALMP